MEATGGARRRDRLFVAVWPAPAVVAVLAGLVRPDEPGVRWTPAENLHVTLRFIGDADADEVAARLAAAPLRRATAVVGPAVGRLGRDAVVVPVVGLDELAAAVCGATAGIGRPVDPRPFNGHLTLARLRHRGACRVAGARVDADFDVREITLTRSTTAPSGARYDTVARFPLG